jgi:hypothetical protein
MKSEVEVMLKRSPNRRRWQRGQAIVILAGALVALLAMVGLVIDGGNAFAQQRSTQNGIDAAAEAGAVELARRMMGLPPVADDVAWDQRVLDAVTATAANNGLTSTVQAEYTDYLGDPLSPPAFVGDGVIPPDTQGVHAGGDRTFSTFFVNYLGFSKFTAAAEATAVTGFGVDTGFGNVIPLTFPLILTQCDTGGGSNKLDHPFGNAEWPTGPNNMIAMPLCSNGPGNVGWLDWDPPYGGASDIAGAITDPSQSLPITTPHWYYVTETGGITSLDDDMDIWEGKDIWFPIYDAHADDPSTPATDESFLGTCDDTPTGTQTLLSDCPVGEEGLSGGQGWYLFVTLGKFHLEHSYIQGNHETECNDPTLASPASSASGTIKNCLIGYFKDRVIASNMTVGPGTTAPTSLTPIAVQLIK